MTEDQKQILEEIKQLTVAYIQHNHHSFFTSEHLKYWDVYDIYNNAQTPQQVVNYLHQNHGIIPYERLPRHEVLVMNRTPLWLWLIQALFIVTTFPLSVPALMILSWVNRGTVNFMRTDGSIYLETVLDLCQQAGVDGPEPPYAPPLQPSFPAQTAATSGAPTLNQGANMQNPTLLQAIGSPIQPVATVSVLSTSDSHVLLQSRRTTGNDDDDVHSDVEKGMNIMVDMGRAFTQVMVENPTMLVDVEVLRTKGKAVFLDAGPLERISQKQCLQKFLYGAAWTKPWQELDIFGREIKVFREFTFVRRPKKTDKCPANIVPPTNITSKLYAFGLSLYQSDTKTLLEQAWQNRGSAPTAYRLYNEALDVAKNNEEYTNAMEALINLHCRCIDGFRERGPFFYRSEGAQVRFHEEMQIKIRKLDEYIDMLPDNYHQCSLSARTLQAYFDEIWNYLERHERVQAWEVFDNTEIKELIETPFVQRCLPHFACLWLQIKGLFFLKGRYEDSYCPEESEATRLQYYMNKTLVCLRENNVPEAPFFEQGFVEPINQMQAHVEHLFQQVPRDLARKYAVQHFRDDRAWALEGRSASFRLEDRGQPTSIPSVFVEPYRDIIARIDAGSVSQSHLRM
jgi:hypothetical protein